ncbi:MAG: zinc-binding dehydrogenase [Lacticaseibacillus paracasei]
MLAMVLNHPGDANVFDPEDRPIPKATATKSVLKIMAFGINHAELITRAGGSPDVHLPRVIGIEAVGVIHETSANSGLQSNQKVMTLMGGFGRAFDGSYEAYALVPNDQLYPVESDLSWEALATIPESFYTAYGSLCKLHLNQGDQLLIRGGSSSVGLAALLMAKTLGLQVTVTTRDKAKVTKLRQFGADHVLIDQGELATRTQFAGVIELVGVTTLLDSMRHVKPNGYVVVTGGLGGQWVLPNFSPFSIQGYLTNFQSTHVNAGLFQAMLALVAKHHLSLPIIQQFDLAHVGAAHAALEKPHDLGKIIVIANTN